MAVDWNQYQRVRSSSRTYRPLPIYAYKPDMTFCDLGKYLQGGFSPTKGALGRIFFQFEQQDLTAQHLQYERDNFSGC